MYRFSGKEGSEMEKSHDIRYVASVLGVKTRTVREWIRKGKISGFKYGISNRWFISEGEIERIRKGVTTNGD